MGWASAGDIFDPVARSLIEAGVSGDVKRMVLGHLIETLQDNDWDTEDESLEEFRGDPAIVAAFADHGVRLYVEDEPDLGEVAYSGYFKACGGKSRISGAELPAWDKQSAEIRAAWQAAADAVREAL